MTATEAEATSNRLSVGYTYEVLAIDGEFYRIIDDVGRPLLFERQNFIVSDNEVPDEWVTKNENTPRFYYGPSEFLVTDYFFEDYCDGRPYATAIYNDYISRHGISSRRIRLKDRNKRNKI